MKAIFLGTFNPPHKGHKDVIESVINYFSKYPMKDQFDTIHIIPCWQNPNKSKSIEYWDRYKMCKLEFANMNIQNNKFDIFFENIEEKLKPEYTYELIRYFHSNSDEYIKDDFWWIITEETLFEIIDGKWKESERLLKENKFIVLYPEERGYAAIKINDYFEEIDKWPGDYMYVPLVSVCDIHSTQLREMIKNKENVDKYINLGVQIYIKENKLYDK